jgi:hypothetical protein
LALKHTVTLLTPGQDYKFKYRAINIFGEGVFSDIVTIKAATKPMKIATASTSIIASTVEITWKAPDIRGSAITAYTVHIQDKSGSNQLELVGCNGAIAPALTTQKCAVALSLLIDAAK